MFDRLRVHIDIARAGKQLCGDMHSISKETVAPAADAAAEDGEAAVVRRRSTRSSTARDVGATEGAAVGGLTAPTRRTTRSMSRGRVGAVDTDVAATAAGADVAENDGLGVVVITAVELLSAAELQAENAAAQDKEE